MPSRVLSLSVLQEGGDAGETKTEIRIDSRYLKLALSEIL